MSARHDALDLNLLRVFVALYDCGSATAAARQMNVTQPALSNALARLREQLDDELFVRGARGMVPTTRAHELVEQFRAALAQIDGALTTAPFDPAQARMTFRVMTTDHSELVLLPPLVARLRREAPNVDVEVVSVSSVARRGLSVERALQTALEEREADLFLGVAVGDGAANLGFLLYTDGYVCLARSAHPLLTAPVTPQSWAEVPHLLVAPLGATKGPVDAALQQVGLERRVALRTTHFAAAPRILLDSDLVMTVPRLVGRLLAHAWDLGSFAPPVAIPDVTFVARWHEQHARSPAHVWFRRLVREVALTVSS